MPDLDVLEPLHIPGLADYHCHCDYSVDAQGTIDEYCRAALTRGLAELCFTTHYCEEWAIDHTDNYIRIDGEVKKTSPDLLGRYVDDVLAAHDRYYPLGLSVKLGVEWGYFKGCEESYANLKDCFDIDYMLCGIHSVEGKSFFAREDMITLYKSNPVKMVEKYFEAIIDAARSGLFDTIAHPLYYLRTVPQVLGDEIRTAHDKFLPEAFAALKDSGTAFEINTSGIRHGMHHYFPPIEVVNTAKKAGVAVTRLGSDAHLPEQVGFEFEAAASLVPSAIMACED